MRPHLLSLLVATLLLGCSPPPGNPAISGGMSANLLLTIEFKAAASPSDDCFEVTLRNISARELNVEVEPAFYEGKVVVALEGNSPVECYDKEYFRRMMCATWGDPVVTMKPSAVLVWKLRIADLECNSDELLRVRELKQVSAYTTIERLAIVPPWTIYPYGCGFKRGLAPTR